MSRYAKNTTVDSSRSRNEIEKILSRYGATGFMYGWQQGQAIIAFETEGRRIKFELPMPNRDDRDFTHTPERGTVRSIDAQLKLYEQAVKQRWRALALVIKAKLEAVESGITEFDEEFLAHIVLPNGQTVGQFMLPQVHNAYVTGDMPPLLPRRD